MKILLLGGTGEAKIIALQLASFLTVSPQLHINQLIYSSAKPIKQLNLPCPIISGGFTQYGGLINFIKNHSITHILNATHPYANIMTHIAQQSAHFMRITYWRYLRPQWHPQTNDKWLYFDQWDDLAKQLSNYQTIFLTTGQLKDQQLKLLYKYHQKHQVIIMRCAVKPHLNLPDWISPIIQRGPFNTDDEKHLIRMQSIDVIVSKNSGGLATVGKLIAARQLNLPVFIVQRSHDRSNRVTFNSVENCLTYVKSAIL